MKIHRRFAIVVVILCGLIAMVAVRNLVDLTSDDPAKMAESVRNPESKPEPEMAVVILNVTGIGQDRGTLKIAIFADGVGFPNHEQAAHLQSLEAGEVDGPIRLDPLLPGNYAIAVYHDVDHNGQLNRAAIGYPTEPYGFSNNARATFGPPSYSDAKFRTFVGEQTLAIELR